MKDPFYFNKITDTASIDSLILDWRKTLLAPQDGMWETFLDMASYVEVRANNQTIGYACYNDENQLLQCYIEPYWLPSGADFFKQLISQFEITSAMVGTNNPIFRSLAMPFQKSTIVDTFLFHDAIDTENNHEETPKIKLAWNDNLSTLVDFYHDSIGASQEWLNFYLNNLISRGELFFLAEGDEILGACEVRNSDTDASISDIGMVVSKHHRQKGLGTFLLGKAKELAYDSNRKPICSCEANNIASLKAIHKNGFRSIHQMLKLSFY